MDYRRLWLQHVLILTLHKVLDLLCFMCVCDLTKHPSRRPCHHVLTVVQFSDVLTHIGPPDAGVTLDVHVVSQSEQHLHTHERDRANQNPACGLLLTDDWLVVVVWAGLPSEFVRPALWLERGSVPGSPSPADRKHITA